MSKKTTKTVGITTTILATAVLLASSFTGTVSAWGPERVTYTNEGPAKYAVFNSITNNVAVGDERNFVRVGEVGSTEPYVDELEVVPGKEYEVYIYYHNDAASSTNESGLGIATNTRVSSGFPTTLKKGERGMVSSIITWSYVTVEKPNDPQTGKVWDEAYLTTNADEVVLKFKAASAIIHNDGKANGSILPSALFSEEGTPIGFNKLAGTIPGCAEYSGHITYTLVAEKKSEEEKEDCTTNPDAPECKEEKNCVTNPEMEECKELPSTGPLEIIMAALIIAGIGGGGYYLYRTRKTLNKVKSDAKGEKVKTDNTPKANKSTGEKPKDDSASEK